MITSIKIIGGGDGCGGRVILSTLEAVCISHRPKIKEPMPTLYSVRSSKNKVVKNNYSIIQGMVLKKVINVYEKKYSYSVKQEVFSINYSA